MLKKTEGIILKTFPYSEADLIITTLTPDSGLIKVFAKSPRKIKSRFGSALEPFSYNKISYWGKEDAELPRLTQADIIFPFQRLRENISLFLKISEITEITLNLLPERSPDSDIYRLLLNTMREVDKVLEVSNALDRESADQVSSRWFLFYKIKLLSLSGFSPRLNGCVHCGNIGDTFYNNEGSVICGSCTAYVTRTWNGTREKPKPVSQGAINLYENIRLWKWNCIHRIKPNPGLINELDKLLTSHIEYRVNKDIKTRNFMNAVTTFNTSG